MSRLWVKFKKTNPAQVSSQGCFNIDDFLKACKKEFTPLLDPYGVPELLLSTSDRTFEPDDAVPEQNTARSPFRITILNDTGTYICSIFIV
jgi:hypothetical protein